MKSLTRIWLLGAVVSAVAIGSPASAAEFAFNFNGTTFFGSNSIDASGVLTTDGVSFTNSLNGYTAQNITGISGIYNGANISGLAPGFMGANNLFYLTGPFFVDGNGLGFSTPSTKVNLFVTGGTAYRVNTESFFGTGLVSASATEISSAVPEPATWAMMLGGFGMVGGAMRYRRRQPKVTYETA